jgi:hypothetical protein
MADNKATAAKAGAVDPKAKPATGTQAAPAQAAQAPAAQGGQTIPAQAPAAPAAPAAKAAKKVSKQPDLSKLSPEDKAKFEKAMADAAELRKKAAELKEEQNRILGIAAKPRASGGGGGSRLMGLNPALVVTTSPDVTVGLKHEKHQAIAEKLKGNGMTLGELLKLSGADFEWFRYRFTSGTLKVNGKSFAEVMNGLATPEQKQGAAPTQPAQAA